jgi:hypothetical protein
MARPWSAGLKIRFGGRVVTGASVNADLRPRKGIGALGGYISSPRAQRFMRSKFHVSERTTNPTAVCYLFARLEFRAGQ